jgi:hypothetical protein
MNWTMSDVEGAGGLIENSQTGNSWRIEAPFHRGAEFSAAASQTTNRPLLGA